MGTGCRSKTKTSRKVLNPLGKWGALFFVALAYLSPVGQAHSPVTEWGCIVSGPSHYDCWADATPESTTCSLFAPDGNGGEEVTGYAPYPQVVAAYPQCAAPAGVFPDTVAINTGATTSTATTTTTTTQRSIDSAVASSNQTAIQTINDRARGADGGQTSLLKSAEDVNQLGANQAATVGAMYCADGANLLKEKQDAAGDFVKCSQYFDAANSMNLSGRKLVPDSAALTGDAAKATLSDFEKNYGITGADYISKMLDAKGSREALSDMLGPDAKLKDAFDAADKLLAEGGKIDDKFAVDLGKGKGATAPARSALRAELRAKLDKTGSREPANGPNRAGVSESENVKFSGLEPVHDGIFADKQDTQELTIFDVVHRKYAEVRGRWMKSGYASRPTR